MGGRLEKFINCTHEAPAIQPAGCLELPFPRREKARQRAFLRSGEEIALMLPRGTIMRGGEFLQGESGRVIAIVAAPEPVSRVASNDPRLLARAAYHLGNRHVRVQVGDGWLAWSADHVLDEMVAGLGLTPQAVDAPFEPEAGAYSGGAPHQHGHSHGH